MGKRYLKDIRKKRVRGKIVGSSYRPRLSVFRSNKHLYVQFIDDLKGTTLMGLSDKVVKKNSLKMTKTKIAAFLGEELAKYAKTKRISKVVFDRGSYKYHGRIKALAEGARKGGLKF